MLRETQRTARTGTPLYWSFFVAFALAVPYSPGLRAQEPAQQTPALLAPFGAEILVSEVLLDVLVTDRKGNPILGLGPADFQVTEDDRKVQVTSAAFYSNRRYAGSEAAPATANSPADNSGLAPHYFIFLFDDQRRNSADVPGLLQRQVRAGKDAIEWLRAGLAPTDWVAVLGYDNRLKLFQDFSQDREALERAIQSATTGRSGRENFPSRQALSAPGAPALAPGLPVGEALSEQTRTIYEALTLVGEALGPQEALLRPHAAAKALLVGARGLIEGSRARRAGVDEPEDHPGPSPDPGAALGARSGGVSSSRGASFHRRSSS